MVKEDFSETEVRDIIAKAEYPIHPSMMAPNWGSARLFTQLRSDHGVIVSVHGNER
jgi:hypothetical protein